MRRLTVTLSGTTLLGLKCLDENFVFIFANIKGPLTVVMKVIKTEFLEHQRICLVTGCEFIF